MSIATKPPKSIEPCSACGRVPDLGERLKWLAGCPDDHRVRYGACDFIFDGVVHVWPDHTYAAVRLTDLHCTEEYVLRWIDAVHAGDVPRRTVAEGEALEFEAWIRQ